MDNKRCGPDTRPVPDDDWSQDDGSSTDHNMISHCGVTFFLLQCYPTKDDPLIQVDIISYFRGLADDDTGAVINEKAVADLCAGVYFYTRQKAVDMGKQSGIEQPSMCPEIVGNTMHPDGMKSRIADKDLQNTLCRRVFFENCLYIFSYGFKKFHL